MNKQKLEDLRMLLGCIILDLHMMGNGEQRTQQLMDILIKATEEVKDDA